MSTINSSVFSAADRQYMAQAMELARNGLYTTTPNPRVGCVLVSQGGIVGSGWHQRSGEPHAEINALANAGVKAKGATAYITLEPCSFEGKTGPCVDALIQAGVQRVVYAAQDPNPKVCGLGHKKLEQAGLTVVAGLFADKSAALNRGFFKRMQKGLPFVCAKMAMSLDGRTAMGSGESQWITGTAARSAVQELRAQSCVIVTGIGTVLHDDPALTVRNEQWGQKVERQPDVLIIDSQLQTPLDCQLLSRNSIQQRKVLIACSKSVDASCVSAIKEQGGIVQQFEAIDNTDHIDLQAVLKFLGQQNYNEVLLEAGASLFGSFVQRGLVDELQLFVAPKFLGSTARPLLELPIEAMCNALALKVVETQSVGEDIKLRCEFQ